MPSTCFRQSNQTSPLPADVKDTLNTVIQAYNVARDAWLTYRGAASINTPSDAYLQQPNTLNISRTGLDGEEILAHTPEIAASTGAACHAGRTEPSSVLMSMGIPREQALGALRLSLGRWTTERNI